MTPAEIADIGRYRDAFYLKTQIDSLDEEIRKLGATRASDPRRADVTFQFQGPDVLQADRKIYLHLSNRSVMTFLRTFRDNLQKELEAL